MKQILSITDIKLLVDSFYKKVREDELLVDIFNGVIKNKWPQHLEAKHFERWIELFYATIEELFEGEKADEAKWRAQKMAEMFLLKIEYYKDRDSKPLL